MYNVTPAMYQRGRKRGFTVVSSKHGEKDNPSTSSQAEAPDTSCSRQELVFGSGQKPVSESSQDEALQSTSQDQDSNSSHEKMNIQDSNKKPSQVTNGNDESDTNHSGELIPV